MTKAQKQALATRYWEGLLSSGMAYEFSLETVVVGAYSSGLRRGLREAAKLKRRLAEAERQKLALEEELESISTPMPE